MILLERKKIIKILIFCVAFFLILFLFPFFLDNLEINQKIALIKDLGNFLLFLLIGICIIDLVFLTIFKSNLYLFFYLNMFFTVLLFVLLEYCFLNNIYEFVYVWRHSASDLPIFYKTFAIWTGGAGSIMTWMLLNSIFIFSYRLKNQDKNDLVFIRSTILSLSILIIFLMVLSYYDPFMTFSNLNEDIIIQVYDTTIESIEIEVILFPDGYGLRSILQSLLLLWHPFFTFCSYAIMIVPFSITIAEIITPQKNLLHLYQKKFFNFSLKCEWLISTLALGLGAYWARTEVNWGNIYWGWDPVETALLVPWIFITAYFHLLAFEKPKKKIFMKLTIIACFLSIIFATLIVRGGGFTSLHAYIRGKEIIIYILIIGLLLILFCFYIILTLVDLISEMYKKPQIFINYSSAILFYFLAFVCIFGLLIPPLTFFLSEYFPITVINIVPSYYIFSTSVPAIGIAISLIFCSIWRVYEIKQIGKLLILIFFIQVCVTFLILLIVGFWINPVIAIYFFALFASLFRLKKDINIKKGFKFFFMTNSKTIIHIGISLILLGTLGGPLLWQDFFYITGFFVLLLGIIPSIVVVFFIPKKKETTLSKENSK